MTYASKFSMTTKKINPLTSLIRLCDSAKVHSKKKTTTTSNHSPKPYPLSLPTGFSPKIAALMKSCSDLKASFTEICTYLTETNKEVTKN